MVSCLPLTRREISLLLFSFTIFVLFYNLETSFGPSSPLVPNNPDPQNSRPNASNPHADWDDVIYGDWTWEEDRVAENARLQAVNKTEKVVISFDPYVFGSVNVGDGVLEWGEDVPVTTVLKHVPGYTIMDNVYVLNGTLFVVNDDPSFPLLSSITSSVSIEEAMAIKEAMTNKDVDTATDTEADEDTDADSTEVPSASAWRMLSTAEARETLGSLGGLIHGVSWLVMDEAPTNYTLFSLWRTYSALDPTLSADPSTVTLPPPRRIIYPKIPTFLGNFTDDLTIVRQRSPSGFHPYLTKAAFPTLALMYNEDWADYALPHVPFVMARVVLADEGAALRAQSARTRAGDVPPYGVPLVAQELEGARWWWEPVRRQVARFVDVPEEAPKTGWLGGKGETVVTYMASQVGPRLSSVDHWALVKALEGLGEGFRVFVVDDETEWEERMVAIAQSTVVVGVYGGSLADAVYMPPSSRATVMEIFPSGVFIRDVEVCVRALKMKYIAWWESRKYGGNKLPSVVGPDAKTGEEVVVDVHAIVQAIRKI